MMNDINTGEIVLYQPDDTIRIEVRVEDETVWLTQAQMAELFHTTIPNVNIHIKNIFVEGELEANSVIKKSLITAADGKKYRTKNYNLDVIISVGYRVKSLRGTAFRRWATTILKEYMLKGIVVQQLIDMVEKFKIETRLRLTETENEIEKLKRYIEMVLNDYNEINENTRIELENINHLLSLSNMQFGEIYQALMKLAEQKRALDKPRNPIGFRKFENDD